VAFDHRNGDLGIAVQSKFPAVGNTVPWAKAKVGAVATQARVNVSYGPVGLQLLESGLSAAETLQRLLISDPHPEIRQVSIVDAKGQVAVHTGKDCMNWAGHLSGNGYSCQGNILVSSKVVESMAHAYENTSGDIIEKLLSALSAGQVAGGDRRGQQSAAILVVREKSGYDGYTDRYVDIRVDEQLKPIDELHRIFRIYDMTILSREEPSNLLIIDSKISEKIQRNLKRLGMYDGPMNGRFDDDTKKALQRFVGMHNFENKMREDGRIWKSILVYREELPDQSQMRMTRKQN